MYVCEYRVKGRGGGNSTRPRCKKKHVFARAPKHATKEKKKKKFKSLKQVNIHRGSSEQNGIMHAPC